MTTYTNTIASAIIHGSDVRTYNIFSGITPDLAEGDTLDYAVTKDNVGVKDQWNFPDPTNRTADSGTYVFTYSVTGTNPQTIAQTRTLYVHDEDAKVDPPDESTVFATGDGTADGGDADDLHGDDTFESEPAKVGLTSSIDEYVHIGRDQFMQVFEEALGDVVVLQVECDINGMLQTAGVKAPHNENLNLAHPELNHKLDLDALAKFEYLLKTQEGSNDFQKRWALLKGNGASSSRQLYQQVRSFLGDFFDHDKELNAIVAQTSTSDPRALVLLDDDKIKKELENLKNGRVTGGSVYDETLEPGVDHSGKDIRYTFDLTSGKELAPIDRRCFATNLMSVRQMSQVLEAFAAMGAGANSRIVRATENGSDYYLYKLHTGDSIIGECKIYDSDAVSTEKQYSQVIKVQLVQSSTSSLSYTASQALAEQTWEGNTLKVVASQTEYTKTTGEPASAVSFVNTLEFAVDDGATLPSYATDPDKYTFEFQNEKINGADVDMNVANYEFLEGTYTFTVVAYVVIGNITYSGTTQTIRVTVA